MSTDAYISSFLLCANDDDHYIPEIAIPLLAGLRGLDDESAAVTIALMAMNAERDVVSN